MDNITVNINNSNDFNEIIHEIKSKQLCNESIKSSKMAKLKLTTQKVNGNDNDGTKMINEFEEYMNKRVPNKNKNKKETTLHKLKSEQNLRKRNLSDTPIFPRITSLILDHEKDNSNSDYSYKTKNTKDYKINKYVSNNKFEKSSIYDIYAKTLKKLSIEEENNEESYYNDSNNITQEKKNKNINRTDIHINESDTSLHNSTSIYETQNSSIEKNRNYLKEKAIRNKDINIKGRKQKSDLIHRYNMNDSENVNFNTSRGNDTKDSYYNSFENSNLSSDHYAYKNKKKNKKENTFYYTNEERNKTYSNESDFSHENLSVEGNVNYRKGDNNNEINNIAENGNNLNDHNSLSIENHKYKKEEAKNDHLIKKKKKKKTLNYSDNHSEKDGSTKSLKIGNEMNMYHSLNDKIYKKRSAIYSKESLKYDKSDITTTDSEYYMNDKYQKYIKKQIPSIEDDYKHKEKLLKIVNSKNILSIRKILIIMREFYIGFIGLQLIYFITYLLFGNNSVYLIQIISISCTFFSLLDANYHGYLLNGFIDMCIAIFLNIAIIENIAGFITLQSNSVLKNITISNVVFLYFFSIFSFLNSYFIYKLHSLERKNIKYVIESIESKVNNDVKNKA
ncbi:conserved Plasmodium protein, unknown function [Plasmodium berghei]|uniref:Basal complex transmembrane protein 1 n=1 Tax=Plasmodium berghei TaxID=5821 RepID=A0A0Y9TDA7_PLABE|nr:conserved Plasmodium protein, unknown function [Plasmodium berghei]SCM19235.1 conserved Plasmodium protein, unknown function [Plasmodium berghei]SCN21671.1 conserved Plasmodium protein, unknown function [Plasmodium berghei]SCO58906.1 conserved Plasmodium protein, unknown function [Plasmodium berghei]SCO58968.1 conserved Plasmodium protein, unknown function [Plasmodium berghei]